MTNDMLNGEGSISEQFDCAVCGGPVRVIGAGGSKYEMSETYRCEACGNEGTVTDYTEKTARGRDTELDGLRKQ
jgi:predicted RNA-binding Zn-ribbon protein involved in translation (DUF1610 family)